MGVQVTDVQKALKGIDYPAEREQLIERAERNGADDDVVEALRGLDDTRFDGPTAVMEGLSGALGGDA